MNKMDFREAITKAVCKIIDVLADPSIHIDTKLEGLDMVDKIIKEGKKRL